VLRRTEKNYIDHWDGQTYRRALVFDGRPVEIEVTQEGSLNAPVVAISIRNEEADPETIKNIIAMMLGLSVDLSGFYETARKDELLAELTSPFIGMRPTRFASLFEALLNAVACQQVSLPSGLQVLNRLSQTFGKQIGQLHTFPTADALALVEPADIKKVGFSLRKAVTISTIARSIVSGDLELERLNDLSDEQVVSSLTSLPGIGRWSAEYVLLRGMGRLDSFPGDDVGGAAKLKKWLSLKTPPTYAQVQELLVRWHPYQGVIYFHLLLQNLLEKEMI
jgi:DNA-3-methyladenine glycosylase II